jgi:hypothetical protein
MAPKWLLLLYGLPTKRGAARVNLWRQLRKSGALALKTSAYLLPDTPEHTERFQWLAQQVRDAGGEATLIRVTEVEGLSAEEIIRQFNEARASDYEELLREGQAHMEKHKKRVSLGAEVEKLRGRYEEVRKIDFFQSPRAQDVQMLLKRMEGLKGVKAAVGAPLSLKKFRGKLWLTRPRPEIDRVGSAWLIRRFIDPEARFLFSNEPQKFPEALPYDMMGVEFTHHGDDCTFETLVKRFGISDKAALQIAEMIHEADLEDGKYQRTEAIGIDRVLKGWGRQGLSDEQLLQKGWDCFDGLYSYLKK